MLRSLLGPGVLLMAAMVGQAGAQVEVRTAAFEAGGLRRSYRLVIPAALPPVGERTLVMLLHGCTQDAADLARGTRIDVRAEELGVIVLMPDQDPAAHPQRCWNWYDPLHARRDSGEVALLAALAQRVAEAEGVDPRRVHVAGISAGGAMAMNLAALFPARFASAAVHSGLPALAATGLGEALAMMQRGEGDEGALVERVLVAMGDEARPVPLLIIHGSADALVSVKAARALAAQWRAVHARLGASGEGVQLRVIDGLGHAWSGGAAVGSYTAPNFPDVTADLLRFLLANPKPGPR